MKKLMIGFVVSAMFLMGIATGQNKTVKTHWTKLSKESHSWFKDLRLMERAKKLSKKAKASGSKLFKRAEKKVQIKPLVKRSKTKKTKTRIKKLKSRDLRVVDLSTVNFDPIDGAICIIVSETKKAPRVRCHGNGKQRDKILTGKTRISNFVKARKNWDQRRRSR